jgi:hypothetical protein
MNQAELEAIRERVEDTSFERAYVKGDPWKGYEVRDNGNGMAVAETSTKVDAEFIAHAREDVPKLLAEIERLRADQERLIAELKKADIFSEELERKYFAAKWPEVEASIKKYAAKMRRERNGSDI